MMEQSVAIKCPTMAGSLIGTKKVQQIFALPGTVERFVKNEEAVKRIRRTFAGLYSLDAVWLYSIIQKKWVMFDICTQLTFNSFMTEADVI